MFIDSSADPFQYVPKISYSETSFLKRHHVDHSSWEARMLTHDFVVARKESMVSLGFTNSYDQYCASHPKIYFEYVEEVIASQFPRMPSFIGYHKENQGMSFYNMFVGKSVIVAEYADFLFSVLRQCEPLIGFEKVDYQGRWAGFLGERLLDYWVHYMQSIGSFSPYEMTVAIAPQPGPRIPNSIKSTTAIRKSLGFLKNQKSLFNNSLDLF
jgi:hypothetical protein